MKLSPGAFFCTHCSLSWGKQSRQTILGWSQPSTFEDNLTEQLTQITRSHCTQGNALVLLKTFWQRWQLVSSPGAMKEPLRTRSVFLASACQTSSGYHGLHVQLPQHAQPPCEPLQPSGPPPPASPPRLGARHWPSFQPLLPPSSSSPSLPSWLLRPRVASAQPLPPLSAFLQPSVLIPLVLS